VSGEQKVESEEFSMFNPQFSMHDPGYTLIKGAAYTAASAGRLP
jgi:hypothetical protein